MEETKKIATLIIVLAVIFAIIGALVSYDLQQYNMKESEKVISGGEDSLVQLNTIDSSSSKNAIVTDRFVGKLEKDAKVVAVGSDGSMYIVQDGTLLVSDMVVNAQNGETTSISRVDQKNQ